MSEYSFNQIKRMEQEATRRAREMSRAAKPPDPEKRPPQSLNPPKTQTAVPKKSGISSFLNALDIKKLIGENSEQAMLLLLVLILSNDKSCDDFLIYALLYIML